MSETETNQNPADAGLNVQDIVNVVKIIDVVSDRGAIKGDELSSVGRVRDRLVGFVQANQPQKAPAEESAPPAETATPTEDDDVETEVIDAVRDDS